MATLVFILELSFQKERQNGFVKPSALENKSDTNNMLPNPVSATVLNNVKTHVPCHNQVPINVPDHANDHFFEYIKTLNLQP